MSHSDNPWSLIWFSPRLAMRELQDGAHQYTAWLLGAVAGVVGVLLKMIDRKVPEGLSWPVLLILAAVGGAALGAVSLWLGSQLLAWVCRRFGGQASAHELVTALGWSAVPKLITLSCLLAIVPLAGDQLFVTAPVFDPPYVGGLIQGLLVVAMLCQGWSIALMISMLAQAQQWTIGRAFGVLLFGYLLLAMPIVLLSILVFAR